MSSSHKTSPYLYVFVLANVLPLFAVFAGVLSMKLGAYFYWGECALVAVLALAMYARYLIVLVLMTMAMGGIVYLANPGLLIDMQPIIIFWCLYSICWLGYIEIGRGSYGQLLRRLRPFEQLLLYIVFMGAAIVACVILTNAVSANGGIGIDDNSITFYQTFVSVAMLSPTISIGLLKVIDMVGQKHFFDFMRGTYHVPQERNSIVLFLDMVGSSTMAEKLQPKDSMRLIAQFIYDCSYIFRINGGDILNYTGDGLVVIWPRDKPNNALAAVHQLHSHFSSKSVRQRYWQTFGTAPDFRIGLHAGTVVISQIGEEKLFLGLYGDVVNTAARLEQMNKETGTNVLLSAEVIHGLNQSWKTLLKPLGEREIRGRDEKIQVFAIYKEVAS